MKASLPAAYPAHKFVAYTGGKPLDVYVALDFDHYYLQAMDGPQQAANLSPLDAF